MEASGWAYTEALSELDPTRADVAAEIAELEGRLTLPRSTELFASDIHGEYNAFSHVLRGGSGAVRALIEEVFGSTLNDDEKAALLALACYPAEHCAYALEHVEDADAWLAEAAARLSKVARRAAGIRTIDEVRALLPDELAIVEELVTGRSTPARRPYRDALIKSLVASGEGVALLEVLGALIQHLVVDQLHLIGDVYDRGPAPQLIMDELLSYPNVDVQWGNHDILWMGAAAGSPGSVANVVRICARYGNLSILEDAYGINLRPLATFAADAYANDPCAAFALKGNPGLSEAETRLTEKVQKAMAVIQFKKLIPSDEGRQRQAALIAFTAFPELKHVWLVDEDVDPFDIKDVIWAMNTRFQADHDVITIPGVRCHPLDPSNDPTCDPSIRDHGIACKTIFDCTVPYDQKHRFQRSKFMDVDASHWVPGFED